MHWLLESFHPPCVLVEDQLQLIVRRLPYALAANVCEGTNLNEMTGWFHTDINISS
jgi:hypothetical protein